MASHSQLLTRAREPQTRSPRRLAKRVSAPRPPRWTESAIEQLLEALISMHPQRIENARGLSAMNWGYCSEYIEHKTGKKYTLQQCKNKAKGLRSAWVEWCLHCDYVKWSGWRWDDERGVPYADEDAMDAYFTNTPAARIWRTTPPIFAELQKRAFGVQIAQGLNAISGADLSADVKAKTSQLDAPMLRVDANATANPGLTANAPEAAAISIERTPSPATYRPTSRASSSNESATSDSSAFAYREQVAQLNAHLIQLLLVLLVKYLQNKASQLHPGQRLQNGVAPVHSIGQAAETISTDPEIIALGMEARLALLRIVEDEGKATVFNTLKGTQWRAPWIDREIRKVREAEENS